MTAKLRIGAIGCGRVATRYHLPAISRCDRAQLTAVVDTDVEFCRAVAKQFGATQVLTDYRSVAGLVDAAFVATGNDTHAEISVYLLDRGVHVICEKPMARTVDEARRMIAASHRSGARLTVAHNCRFSPTMKTLKRLLTNGCIGDLVELSAGFGGPHGAWQARTQFRQELERAGGGVLMDLGVHVIDLALWLSNQEPIESITCESADLLGWGVESEAEVALHFAGGAVARLACSATRELDRILHVRGTRGWISAPVHGTDLRVYSPGARICQRDGAQVIMVDERDAFQAQIDEFCEAVLTGGPFSVSADEGLAALAVIERCYASRMAA